RRRGRRVARRLHSRVVPRAGRPDRVPEQPDPVQAELASARSGAWCAPCPCPRSNVAAPAVIGGRGGWGRRDPYEERVMRLSPALLLAAATLAGTAAAPRACAAPVAYVTNSADGTVSVLDTVTNTITATVPVGSDPIGVAVDPRGMRVYVTNPDDGTGSVIDTATNTTVATVPVGASPSGVAVTADGTRAYVANACGTDAECSSYNGTISVLDTATNAVVTTVATGASPMGLALSPDGTRAYMVNSCGTDATCSFTTGGTVSVLDTATNTVVATVPVGQSPVAFGEFIGPAPTPATTTTTTTQPASAPTTTTLPCMTVRCLLGAGLLTPACAGQTVPASVESKFDQATRFAERAATSPPRRARKLSRRAKKALRQARARATSATKRKKRGISS